MPYRVLAPPPPEEPEQEEPYAAVIRAHKRNVRLMALGAALVAAFGVAKVAHSSQAHRGSRARVTEADRLAKARAAVESARARATREQARFDAAIREAIGDDVGPRPDLGACPITLSPQLLHAVGTSSLTSSSLSRRPLFPLVTIDSTDLKDTLPSQAVAGVLADVRRAEKHVAAGRYEEASLYARALDVPERFGIDVVLHAKTSRRPEAVSGTQFVAGEISGRAYVYDHREGKVVCAGDVTAKSSKELSYVFADQHDAPASLGAIAMMRDAIEEDMRQQTERAVLDAVKWRAGRPR